MQIVLIRETKFQEGLSETMADEALEKARASSASQYFEFRVTADPGGRSGWSLVGLPRGLHEAAMAEPNGFLINIGED